MRATEKLTIKVLPAHKVSLREIARAEGESMASVVRRMIRKEAEQRGIWIQSQQHTRGGMGDG